MNLNKEYECELLCQFAFDVFFGLFDGEGIFYGEIADAGAAEAAEVGAAAKGLAKIVGQAADISAGGTDHAEVYFGKIDMGDFKFGDLDFRGSSSTVSPRRASS